MDARLFLENFAKVADTPDGVQRLRDLVLDLAVCGRLVPQDPSDEPASLLLHRIRDERQRLVDDGRIPRPKKLPKLSADVEVLPPGWSRVCLADAVAWDMTDGDWVESKDQDPEGEVRLVQLADVGVGSFKDKSARFLTAATAERLKCTPLELSDVLIARLPNPLGRACAFPGSGQVCVTVVDVAIARTGSEGVSPAFLVHTMNASRMRRRVEQVAAGTTRKRVSTSNLRQIPILVPPLAEQQRIVAKVDELIRLCDELEARAERRHRATTRIRGSALHALTEAETPNDVDQAWERVSTNWSALTDDPDCIPDLRRSILRLAIDGRMRSSATRGKWTECLFGDQITLQRGFDITKSQQRPGPYPVVSSGGVLSHHAEPACAGPGVVIGRKGSVGRVHWVPEDYWPHDTTLWVKDFHGNEPEYVYWFLRSFPLLEYENSTANPSLNRNRLHPVPVLWPSPDLQGELVERIRRAFDLCDRIDSAMKRRDRVSSSLSESLCNLTYV